MQPRFRTEEDLLALRGQPESSRLEFKSSALLKKSKEQIVKDLSKWVSAFANSEGGDIIIGIVEEKSGKGRRVAAGIDEGVDPNEVSPESLQQRIEYNVSPYLPGVKVRLVSLPSRQGRVALVISVPQGSTAYQASDMCYYGRSEFEVRALPDHEIRLRMMRGRVPEARLEVAECELLTADEEFAERQAALEANDAKRTTAAMSPNSLTDEERAERMRAWLEADNSMVMIKRREALRAPKRTFDEYSFRLSVANPGQVTLLDFLLLVSFDTKFEVSSDGATSPDAATGAVRPGEWRYRFAEGQRKEAGVISAQLGECQPPPKKIFPGQRLLFPGDRWTVRVPAGTSMGAAGALLRWTIHLDNATPASDEINFADCPWCRPNRKQA